MTNSASFNWRVTKPPALVRVDSEGKAYYISKDFFIFMTSFQAWAVFPKCTKNISISYKQTEQIILEIQAKFLKAL